MSLNWVPKEVNWLTRWQTAIVNLLAAIDAANQLASEYTTDAYGTGGANAIIDATVQAGNAAANGPMPSQTALTVAESVGIINGSGALNAQYGQGGTSRGYLENMRP
jgi:hypothetical protein